MFSLRSSTEPFPRASSSAGSRRLTVLRSLLAIGAGGALAVSLLGASATAAPDQVGAAADTVSPAADNGLFGAADPTFDGVFRQSFAILGLQATGSRVPADAIEWLIDQQCPDGSFTSYRADTTAPCPEPDLEAFTGPDTNSTSLAALALDAVGADDASAAAAAWLLDGQTRGGGWPYLAGGSPDTNSTGLALAAIDALNPRGHKRSVRIATNFLRRAQVPCGTERDDRFGMPYQAGLNPDTFSSSQSLLGLSGAFPVRERNQRRAVASVECRLDDRVVDPMSGVARWISRLLNTNDGALPNTFDPSAIDWNSTAVSILGLVATRTSGIATDRAVAALADNIEEYIGSDSGDRPAALGVSLLVTEATGSDPRDFGGADLTARLLSTRQG